MKEGDKRQGLCPKCKMKVPITISRRAVEGIPVKNSSDKTLVSICDKCFSIVGVIIPYRKKTK